MTSNHGHFSNFFHPYFFPFIFELTHLENTLKFSFLLLPFEVTSYLEQRPASDGRYPQKLDKYPLMEGIQSIRQLE